MGRTVVVLGSWDATGIDMCFCRMSEPCLTPGLYSGLCPRAEVLGTEGWEGFVADTES